MKFSDIIKKVVFVVAVTMSLFQLYTAAFGNLEAMLQRSFHLTFALPLAFLLYPRTKKKNATTLADAILALLSTVPGIYIYMNYERIATRWAYSDVVTIGDVVVGLLLIVLLIEAARRIMGLAMGILISIFFVYAVLGQYIPGVLGYGGSSLSRIIEYLFLTTDGIFGTPLGTSATYVVLFIIFGAFLGLSGSGQYFMNLAISLTGRKRGGPAKIGVISSALFGSISGAAVANVYATGSFTIPLMKKIGYKPQFAGAVEAVASTGGQIMPPIMGSAAFIMADMLGVPYITIMKAAIIPAILYFLAVYIMVDLEAGKMGLVGMSEKEIPCRKGTLKQSYLLIPAIGIIFILSIGFTASASALIGIILAVIVSQFTKENRIGPIVFLKGLVEGAKGAVLVAIATGAAGIIVGIATNTGLGFKFTSLVTSISDGNVWIAGFLVMLASIILGMGLPTVAAFIMVAALTAPALMELGVGPLAAQMFVFYYCSISSITPPVALSAYAGASIAGSDPFRTGFTAMRLGILAFIIPFMFLNTGELLLEGSVHNILIACVTAVLGTVILGVAIQGYLFSKLHAFLRIVLLGVALLAIKPGLQSDLIAFLVFVIIVIYEKTKQFKKRQQKYEIL